MADYDNNFTGILSKNDRATTEKHPGYKGQATIDGVEYWISAWVKERKDGTGKFFSMRFEEKDQQKRAAPQTQSPAQQQAPINFDDDLPF